MRTTLNTAKTVTYSIVGWLFCVGFGALGLLGVWISPLTGLLLLSVSALAAPPVRARIYQHFERTMPATLNIAMVAIFFLALFFQVDYRKLDALQAEEERKQEIIDTFQAKRGGLLSDLKKAYDQEKYQSVVARAEPYLITEDPELTTLHENAQQALARIAAEEERARQEADRKATTEKIVAQLKTIPAAQIHRNQALYARLVALNPDEQVYQDKLDHYTAKVDQEKARQEAEEAQRRKAYQERVAQFGKPPRQSGWDGSYLAVSEYLRYVANDPDSIEFIGCTEVNYHSDGWLVGCNYRGRNGFGGLIRQSNWFTIRHGSVVEMHDGDAFRASN